jgi:AcrR family transcriptional regulator
MNYCALWSRRQCRERRGWRSAVRNGKMPVMPLPRRPRRPGRPAGAVARDSRGAILKAARELFAKQGFVRATTRAIASKAGVDAALVHYFFETKKKLFAEAVDMPAHTRELEALFEEAARDGGGKGTGERVVRFMLEQVFTSRGQAISALMRASLADPTSAPALRSLIEETVVTAAASSIRGSDSRLRAELFGAMMVGLFVVRYVVRVEPIASASPEAVAKRLGPAFDVILAQR